MDKMKILETIGDAAGLFVLCALAACGEEWFGAPAERTLLVTVLWQLLTLRSAAEAKEAAR